MNAANIEFPQAVCSDDKPHAPHRIAGTLREDCPGRPRPGMNGTHTFRVEVQFSDEVLETAIGIALRDGNAAVVAFLEKKLDNALEGGYFEGATVTLQQF